MKRKFSWMTGMILFVVLAAGTQLAAEEKTKEYHESWPVENVQTLEIDNKFGEVKITDKGGDVVTIDVVITVEASGAKQAEELLDQIEVNFGKTGGTVTAETEISRNFRSRDRFSIDYEVNIPPDKNLHITNKYGNTFVHVLNANGMFDIQYGNFKANALNMPSGGYMNLELSYGKADLEAAGDLKTTVQYSTINVGKSGKLVLNSKYNVVHIQEAELIEADSRYDTFRFGTVGSLSAITKYTRIQVAEMLKELNLEAGYGGVKIDRVDSGFGSISVTSSYGEVSLGLADSDYALDASCDYCGISYPENRFSGDRSREGQSSEVKGVVGSRNSKGKVLIRSRYGQINLK